MRITMYSEGMSKKVETIKKSLENNCIKNRKGGDAPGEFWVHRACQQTALGKMTFSQDQDDLDLQM